MGVILNGVGIGFLAAIFISLYTEFLFEYVLPLPILYGIFAPFFSALAIAVLTHVKKSREKIEGFEEK